MRDSGTNGPRTTCGDEAYGNTREPMRIISSKGKPWYLGEWHGRKYAHSLQENKVINGWPEADKKIVHTEKPEGGPEEGEHATNVVLWTDAEEGGASIYAVPTGPASNHDLFFDDGNGWDDAKPTTATAVINGTQSASTEEFAQNSLAATKEQLLNILWPIYMKEYEGDLKGDDDIKEHTAWFEWWAGYVARDS
jgi:hypothetical protein